jgi:hypothetical protein
VRCFDEPLSQRLDWLDQTYAAAPDVAASEAADRIAAVWQGADGGYQTVFEIDGGVLDLSSGVVLDHQIQPQLEVTVEVDDPTSDSVHAATHIDDARHAVGCCGKTLGTSRRCQGTRPFPFGR